MNLPVPNLWVFVCVSYLAHLQIRGMGKTKTPHSVNTEVWLSDFFWPFFANYTYAEIAKSRSRKMLNRRNRL